MTKSRNWLIENRITPTAEENLQAFPPLFRQLLFNRGYASDEIARLFLKAKVPFETSAWQLKGMHKAIDRIETAIELQQSIIVYGDYDVDGVTATALLVEVLKSIGAKVNPYIPNRFDEGYGLNIEALEQFVQEGCGLVITVDCGIRSIFEVDHAAKIGLDLIITDHHSPGMELPNAFAVINPKQADDKYPDKDLAGVGVAYKLAEALFEKYPEKCINCENLLDLVVLGTVADLAPLIGENRHLVRRGLVQLRHTKRQGLFSLATISGLDLKGCNSGSIGFILGPRLNASGRLESALASYELLTTEDVQKAGELAQKLEIQNRERQQITRATQEQAEDLVLAQEQDEFLLFAAAQNFNSGVVGLAASRLSEKFYKPAVVASIENDTTRGSCRSIPEFHITEALDKCSDLLVRHGGHAAAAGFTVLTENLEELQDRLKKIARDNLVGLDLRPTLCADLEISLSELNSKVLEQLSWFEPTGYGNPEPLFISRGVQILSKRTVGKEGNHLKLIVTDGYTSFDAIGFNLGYLFPQLTKTIDLMYTFELNIFNGRETLQLRLKDIKFPDQTL